jgi:bifunctional ADP-heptose synthase (sugar kinase/adenylyltransferase)
LQNNLHNLVIGLLEDLDLVIFSDFNYGCLPQGLIDSIINFSKRYPKIIFAADSQSSSQMGDISRFHGMDLVTPTEREARVSLRNQEDGLVVLAEKLRIQCNAKNVFLKLGSEGLIIQSEPADKSLWITDRLIALNEAPLDPAGAGDSMLATSSLALTCTGSIWEASLLGSIAAAIQVSRVGNMPISFGELKKVIAS